MKKHAYLILAHNEFGLLESLVNRIDDERNDIFIHFDKKVKDLPSLTAHASNLYYVEDRIDVKWGDLSVVKAEYSLFSYAAKHGRYEYYHLLSGVDSPLKSQDYIHDFCEKNQGKEFIGFSTYDCRDEVKRKVNRWHLFPEDFKNKSTFKRGMRSLCLRIQEMVGYERNKDIEFRKGTQWVSITDDFVQYLLSAQAYVMKVFTHTFCADEIYKQTLCWNSEFREKVYNMDDEGLGCMRSIGWSNNEIKPWTTDDFAFLSASPSLFARKFSSDDPEILDKIDRMIHEHD